MTDLVKTKIIIVEDERIVALNLKQRLTKLGYSVTALVTSGEKALAAITASPPDIVLMDIHIDGDMDGIETASLIPEHLHVPVVYLTAYSEEATLERARQTRPYGYLLKPFSERELHATMQMVLERRRADGLLRQKEETLSSQIRIATRELEAETAQRIEAEQALLQVQKMEAIGELTGGVAHDFNNLLTPIIGGLDLLQRRGVGNEREQRIINGALTSAERAKVLVQRLLAFARRQPLQPTSVDVGVLLSGMADLVLSSAAPAIRIEVNVEPGLMPAHADANQLEMAVLNLCVNARDAMPDGGILTITAETDTVAGGHPSKLPPGRFLRLAASDTGIGMDAVTASRAVEPFFSTKGVGKGTGLGLSMVHGLASQLGGAMAVSSQTGVGTTIEIWLPFSTEAPKQLDLVVPQLLKAHKPNGVALLVDDEDLVRMSTADMLEELGYTVVEVSRAQDALDLLASGRIFDVLLTDHIMPGMTGSQLLERVREHQPDLPMLLISGYADAQGIAADMPRLTKPFRQAELAESLAAIARTSSRAA